MSSSLQLTYHNICTFLFNIYCTYLSITLYPLEDEENIVHEYNDIVRLEDRAEISYFLNFLSSEQREAVILRFGEQLSFGEIAKVMGCNMRTAQSRVRNALKIMRKEQENER